MSVVLKSTDLIKQFNGVDDFSAWLRKFELVARLQKVSELELFMPLFLNDGALAVYESLSENVKSDYGKLKQSLTKAFSVNKFTAFDMLCERKLNVGESVDVYIADLRRLTGLVSQATDNEDWLQCLFIRGLPDVVRRQLMAACKLEDMSIDDIVCRTRSLIQVEPVEKSFSSLTVSNQRVNRDSVVCYSCNKKGHISYDCINKPLNKMVRCYACGKEGHISPNCPRKSAKNE
jgi:hypothetical protein